MDNELPAEVMEELEAAAQDKYTKMAENAEDAKDEVYAQGFAEGWHTGATEYATKLHAARTLLEKFISRHEGGLLPDMFIYKEINNFLDGTK